MKISADHIGKRFSRSWIFKNFHYQFQGPGAYALLGRNGSGKSTLLRLLSGMQLPSAGKLSWEWKGKLLSPDHRYALLSFSAPGMSLPEELSLKEFLEFHFQFKKPQPGLDIAKILTVTQLGSVADRPLDAFSSGMLQRVKLAQAIFSDTPFLFLDEPCTNLDDHGVNQYRQWIQDWTSHKLVLVASNDPREYAFCSQRIQVQEDK